MSAFLLQKLYFIKTIFFLVIEAGIRKILDEKLKHKLEMLPGQLTNINKLKY